MTDGPRGHGRAPLRARLPIDVDVVNSLRYLRLGRLDPTWGFAANEAVHAAWTPEGAATLQIRDLHGEVEVYAHGPGAAWVLPRVADLVGAQDAAPPVLSEPPLLADLSERFRRVRFVTVPVVLGPLIGVVLQQRVTFEEASRSWRRLCLAYGEPAPGPFRLHTPPDPAVLAGLPYETLHPLGVERRRAALIRALSARGAALERLRGMTGEPADAMLRSWPGIGPWTSGMLRGFALGDADAVPLGDAHLPNTVAWALRRVPRADDAAMLRLLEAYRPHRARVLRWLMLARVSAPRRGPGLRSGWHPGT